MNTTYRKNLKDVAIACKNYVDTTFNNFRWELGSHTLDVTTDTDTKYLKSVPNYTIGCKINTLGGMSYKSENLLVMADEVKTASSVQFTISDGTISSSGTPSSTGWIRINEITLPLGTYSFKDLTSSTTKVYLINSSYTQLTTTFTLNATTTVYVAVQGSAINNNGNLNKSLPMLVSGSTAPTTWKQGFTGIRDSAVTSVVSRKVGLNSLRLTQIGAVDLGTLTWEYRSTEQKFKSQQISGMKSGGVVYCTKYAYDGNTGFDAQTMNNMTIRSHNASPLVYIKDTNYTDATTFKNSLNGIYLFYELATELATPQQAVIDNLVKDTLSINASIQNLTGYGWGVNNTCYNYIDYDRKVFVQKVGRYTFAGNENWSKAGQSYGTSALDSVVKFLTSNSETINCLIIGFTPSNANQVYGGAIENSISGIATGNANKIRIYSSAFESVADVQSALAGKTLYYELATPVETDISAYLTTDAIDVEPLGTLEFTNTYSQDVPSDIDYLIEEVKA